MREISISLIRMHYLLRFKEQYIRYANLYNFPVYELFPKNINDCIKKKGLKNLIGKEIIEFADIERVIKYSLGKIKVYKK